jgi:methionyl-tRNA synthetase
MDGLALHEGVAAAFQLVDAANEFIAETAPWALAKDPAQGARLDDVLYDVAEVIRVAAVLLTPVMPSSCAEILRRVGAESGPGGLRLDDDGRWRAGEAKDLVKGAALWPRSEERTLDEKPITPVSAPAIPPAPTASAPVAQPEETRISIDDFMKVELRVARVLEAEAVPKSKKLLKLTIDAGGAPRTIVAGLAEAYTPDQIVGRTVVIVANLKPAKLMGIESNGMVLAASPEGGSPTLLDVAADVAPGARVR